MILDKLLFKSKHWQNFAFYLGIIFLNSVLFQDFSTGYLLHWIFFTWGLLIGARLKRKLPAHYNSHYVMFLISGFLLIVIGTLSMTYQEESDALFPTNKLITLIPLVILLTLGSVFLGFLARAMKSLETKDPPVAAYGGDVFLWITYIIGVWIIQPRLNRIYDRYFSGDN